MNLADVDPYKRNRTRHRGITYRVRADGSRAYSVWAAGGFVSVDGGEKEAVAKQADLRGKIANGTKIVSPNVKFGVLSEEWLASKRKLRTRSRANYRQALDLYLLPRFKNLKLGELTPDRVATLVRDLEAAGKAGATIQNILKPLNGTFKLAARRGITIPNPVALLTPDERPEIHEKQFRELSPDDVATLLDVASRYAYGPVIRTAIFTGLRVGELLGLAWQDLDFERSILHVRRQWAKEGAFTEPKTKQSKRDVVLAPALVAFLKEHRKEALATGRARPEDLVFASRNGTPLGHRNVNRSFTKIVKLAGLDGEPKVTFHVLRAIYAAMMIERGVSAMVLCKQLGHKDPSITMKRYAHLFNRAQTDESVRQAVEEAMGLARKPLGLVTELVSTGGNQQEVSPNGGAAKVAQLHGNAPAASA